jgi:hypothetical protein
MKDEIPRQREVFEMPRMAAVSILATLAALCEQHDRLSDSGLLVEVGREGWHRLFFCSDRDAKGAEAFRQALLTAVQADGGMARLGRASGQAYTRDVTGLLDPLDAAVAIAALSGPAVPLVAASLAAQEMMILVHGGLDALAAPLASALRQGRDVRIVTQSVREGGEIAAALFFSDDADDYGAVSSLLGRSDLPTGFDALRSVSVGGRKLWLALQAPAPDPAALAHLGRILETQESADLGDIAFLQKAQSAGLIARIARRVDATPAGAAATATMPIQPFDLQKIAMRPDADAAQALASRIAAIGRRIGYRVSVAPAPRNVSAGMDLEPLLEQIDDLTLQIAQINALGAPQMRLMRFSDAQLPAMIDALRHLPPQKLRDGSISYAAGHSAGQGGPAHYLIYDPSDAAIRLAEAAWQARTESRPMSYWLEPFVAQAHMARPTTTRVFVPSGHFLTPSLAHFGGDVDDALRLVLGNLFADLANIVEGHDARPLFLFTQPPGRNAPLEVEALDGRSFAPLHQQIGWINDYLQVRGPASVDRAKLAILAEELYEGAFVDAVRKDLAATSARLTHEWADAGDRIRREGTALVAEHAAEIEAVAARIKDVHAYLRQADREMRGLEQLMEAAGAALGARAAAGQAMSAMDAEMQAMREAFDLRATNELLQGERAVQRIEDGVARLRARIDRLVR